MSVLWVEVRRDLPDAVALLAAAGLHIIGAQSYAAGVTTATIHSTPEWLGVVLARCRGLLADGRLARIVQEDGTVETTGGAHDQG